MVGFLALVEYHLVTNAAKMYTGDMDDAWMLVGRAFKPPTRVAALIYVWRWKEVAELVCMFICMHSAWL